MKVLHGKISPTKLAGSAITNELKRYHRNGCYHSATMKIPHPRCIQTHRQAATDRLATLSLLLVYGSLRNTFYDLLDNRQVI